MTSEEIDRARKEGTWLVVTSFNKLVKASHAGLETPHWRVVNGRWSGWIHLKELRLATAKDLLELSDD